MADRSPTARGDLAIFAAMLGDGGEGWRAARLGQARMNVEIASCPRAVVERGRTGWGQAQLAQSR